MRKIILHGIEKDYFTRSNLLTFLSCWDVDEYFQREALMAHNKYRSVHNAPPLELDPQLSLEAEQLAQLLTKPDGARKKVDMENEGENIARGCSEWGGLTASGAVHRW